MCKLKCCRGKALDAKGVAVCVVDWDHKLILLGRERFGRYMRKLNVAAGSLEEDDGRCIVRGARRELREEFKIVPNDEEWERRARLAMYLGRTPVFVLRYRVEELFLPELNRIVAMENNDPTLPGHYKEMSELCWVRLGQEDSITGLARAIVRRLRVPQPFTVHRTIVAGSAFFDPLTPPYAAGKRRTDEQPKYPYRGQHRGAHRPLLGV